MKKFSFIMLLSFSVLILFSCKDNETGPDDTSSDGYKINVYTWSTENSEYTIMESDTIKCSGRYSAGITSPNYLSGRSLICLIYKFDINDKKVLCYHDSVYVPIQDSSKEIIYFDAARFSQSDTGNHSIEVTIHEEKDIKLTRDVYLIIEE